VIVGSEETQLVFLQNVVLELDWLFVEFWVVMLGKKPFKF